MRRSLNLRYLAALICGSLLIATSDALASAPADTTEPEEQSPELPSPEEPVTESSGRLTDSINRSGTFVMTKDPVTAVLWGLIPGGGQVYTEQYWKVPLFVVPIGVLTGLAIYFEGKRSDFAAEAARIGLGNDGHAAAAANRNTNQDRRDLSIAGAGAFFLLSLVDAYVGAHLYDFDVGDSLASVRLYPDPDAGGLGVAIRW